MKNAFVCWALVVCMTVGMKSVLSANQSLQYLGLGVILVSMILALMYVRQKDYETRYWVAASQMMVAIAPSVSANPVVHFVGVGIILWCIILLFYYGRRM